MLPRLLALSLLTGLFSAVAQPPLADVTGMLEYLSPTAIVVRAPDNREIQVRIPQNMPGLANGREVGDWVYLRFQKTTPTLDTALGVMLSVELTDFLPLHKPFESELQAAQSSPTRKVRGNLLAGENPPSPEEPSLPAQPLAGLLEKVNAHLADMSNFIASEVTTRFRGSGDSSEKIPFDQIQTEVHLSGRREVRTNIVRNTKPWQLPYEALPGMKWQSAFAARLGSLFSKRRNVTFSEESSSVLDGHAVAILSFRTPADSFSHWYFGEQGFWPASEGKIWIAKEDGRVLQFEQTSTGFPPDFPLAW